MKTAELLLKLQKDIKQFESKVKPNPDCLDKNNTSLECTVSRYNLQNFHELLDSNPEDFRGDSSIPVFSTVLKTFIPRDSIEKRAVVGFRHSPSTLQSSHNLQLPAKNAVAKLYPSLKAALSSSKRMFIFSL
jgi:hypothetical protein